MHPIECPSLSKVLCLAEARSVQPSRSQQTDVEGTRARLASDIFTNIAPHVCLVVFAQYVASLQKLAIHVQMAT